MQLFENHLSIIEIKKQISSDVMTSKRKILKKNYDVLANFITENFSDMIKNSVFLDSLK